MPNPEFVSYSDAEVPLIAVALADPHLPNESAEMRYMRGELSVAELISQHKRGEVYKERTNGWIYFRLPGTGDEPGDNRAQVWGGTGEVYRNSGPIDSTLLCTLEAGIISEHCIQLRARHREVSAFENPLEGHQLNPNLPARQLLLDGIDWIVAQTLSLQSL